MSPRFVVALMLSMVTAVAAEVPLDSILAHPKKYHRQPVTVSGFARVNGESFVLYRDSESAKRLDLRALSVAQRRKQPMHNHLNNHWVVATGVVDANAHGLWGFPCELLLEEVHSATPMTSNQSLKAMAPLRFSFNVFATTPCRGLSLSR